MIYHDFMTYLSLLIVAYYHIDTAISIRTYDSKENAIAVYTLGRSNRLSRSERHIAGGNVTCDIVKLS